MTKALIVSDNHGDRAILEQLVDCWKEKVDLMVHCGDSEISSSDSLMQSFVRVAGNNDWHLGYDPDQLVLAGGARFLVTHGHNYGVNSSMTSLKGNRLRLMLSALVIPTSYLQQLNGGC